MSHYNNVSGRNLPRAGLCTAGALFCELLVLIGSVSWWDQGTGVAEPTQTPITLTSTLVGLQNEKVTNKTDDYIVGHMKQKRGVMDRVMTGLVFQPRLTELYDAIVQVLLRAHIGLDDWQGCILFVLCEYACGPIS